MQSRSYLFLAVVVVLGVLSGLLYYATKPQYGLDVQGGIRLVYRLDFASVKNQNVSKKELQQRTIAILTNRAGGVLGATEVSVYGKGDDQVIVEIPGATNVEDARKVMGNSARIYMYHATTLATEKWPNRPYREQASENPDDPAEYFTKAGSPEVIKPDDPEYKKIIEGWKEILSGEDLEKADMQQEGNGSYIPNMRFSPSGAKKMGDWSHKYYNTGEKLAYVLDGKVLNVAPIAPGAIITDAAQITGRFSTAYVRQLRDLLNAGSLPVNLVELSYQNVDPTIGKQALGQIEKAGIGAFIVVSVFLIGYYAFPGIIATIALALYVLFTLSAMKLFQATFSLAAIAGFILSVGMAVDANILVFERFKEEMKRGRSLHSAIDLGFRRALSAIIDSNACTILTSLVLWSLGTGAVKGFATSLIYGVLISLFTAVVVTRSLLMFFVDSGIATNPKLYAVDRNWFKKYEERADTEPIQVVEKSKKWFVISALTIIVCIPFFFIGGFKVNVEFQGGYEAVYSTPSQVGSNTTYAANLEKNGLKGGNVKFASYSPELLTLTLQDPAKLAGATTEAKIATLAGILGNPAAKPQTSSMSNNQLVASFVTDDLRGPHDEAAPTTASLLIKLKNAEVGAFKYDSAPDAGQKRNLIYVTVPPNPQIAAILNSEGKPDTTKRSEFVAEKAGLTDVSPREFTEVGSTVSKETIQNAVLAVVFSAGLIIVYLSFRFGFSLGGFVPGLRFGWSAILALMHDILVVVGTSAVVGFFLGWEISALFITAMLTVIGFSVHDTIVVFDRIRENLRKPDKHHDLGFVMDKSITQSFARSINTSGTVVVTLAILIIWGTATPDLKFFCVAMLVGIVSGTYSSIYNASPILYLWDKAVSRKDPKKGLIGLALEEQAKARVVRTQVRVAEGPQVQSQDTGRTYGQVRRRSSEQKKGHIDIEDEP